MRKITVVLGLVSMLVVGLILRHAMAGVQMQTISNTQYKFDVGPGDRIVVLRKGYTGTFRVTSGKDFDFSVPAGKTLVGILVLR